MHEASLVQGLLQIVLKAFEEHKAAHPGHRKLTITQIICEAGLIANFESKTLKACFELFAEGTAAQNAELVINAAPLDCKCAICGKTFQLKDRNFICPGCGSEELNFKGGYGLVLQAVKVEESENG